MSCLESADQLERAAAECQAILTECPTDATTRGYVAHLQLKMGRPEDAIQTVSEALPRKNNHDCTWFERRPGRRLDNSELAMGDLNVALFQDADTAGAYLLRSRLHLSSRQFDQTIADVDQYHRTAGQSVESVSLKATALRGKRVPEEAAKILTAAMQDGLDHPLVKFQRADCLAEAGKLELALEDCDSVISQFPEAAAAYVVRAAVHLQSGRHEAALEDAVKAVELGMEVPRVILVLGLAKAAAGDPEQGEEDLTRAVQLDPEDVGALFHRARLRTLLGNDDAAIDDLSAAIRCHPDWSDALVQRGFLQLKTERPDAAMEDFEAAIRIAPRMAEAYRGRAGAHVLKGHKAEALADLDKAVMLDPDNVACRLARTNLLLCEDDRQGAKADLDAALQISPDLIPALFQRAQLYLSLGEHGAARRDFDAILSRRRKPRSPLSDAASPGNRLAISKSRKRTLARRLRLHRRMPNALKCSGWSERLSGPRQSAL